MHTNDSKKQSALLLVAFGSSLPHTQALYNHLVELAQHRYPESEVFLAFSSQMVLARLAREGRPAPDVRTQVSHIAQQGYTHLKVLPLFAIGGEDFNKWSSQIADLALQFHSYTLGSPLLHTSARVEQVARLVLRAFPERSPSEILLLMGHGSPHGEGRRFGEMAQQLQHLDPLAFMGCVEGDPDLSVALQAMQKTGKKNVVLAPFMMVTGDHAMNDMAGEDEDSWKSQLEKAGYTVRVVQRGLLQIPDVVDLLLGIPL